MVKAPTNSEIRAKTRSTVERTESRVADRAGQLAGDGLAADNFGTWRQHLGDLTLEGDVVGARLGQDVDGVEITAQVEQSLRRRQGKTGQRFARQVVSGTERHDAGDHVRAAALCP